MKIKNKILLSVDSSDLVDGKFINKEVTGVGDGCFNEMRELKEVDLIQKTNTYALNATKNST